MARLSRAAISTDMAPPSASDSRVSLRRANLRMDMVVPSSARGWVITLTRLPSSRRASTMGLASSMRRPTRAAMRWAVLKTCSSSMKVMGVSSSLPNRSTKTWSYPLTRMSLTVSSSSSGSMGPTPSISSSIWSAMCFSSLAVSWRRFSSQMFLMSDLICAFQILPVGGHGLEGVDLAEHLVMDEPANARTLCIRLWCGLARSALLMRPARGGRGCVLRPPGGGGAPWNARRPEAPADSRRDGPGPCRSRRGRRREREERSKKKPPQAGLLPSCSFEWATYCSNSSFFVVNGVGWSASNA